MIRYVRRGVGDRPKHASIFVCRGNCPELLDRVRHRLSILKAEGEWVAGLPRLARISSRLDRSSETELAG